MATVTIELSIHKLIVANLIMVGCWLFPLLEYMEHLATPSSIYMLDVGQGDSMLLRNNGVDMLIDTGKGDEVLEAISSASINIDIIDLLIISHPDADHAQGAIAVMEQWRVENIMIPRLGQQHVLNDYLLEIAAANGVNVWHPVAGDHLQVGDINLQVLWPRAGDFWDDINDMSIGMHLSIGELDLFSAGDLSRDYELIAVSEVGEVELIKVGHHGSYTSTSAELLQQLQPQAGLISAGVNNSYGHPHTETLSLLEHQYIVRTDQSGTVMINYHSDSYDICVGMGSCKSFKYHGIKQGIDL